MMQSFSTPTELHIKKAAGGYLLETLVEFPIEFDPVTRQPKMPCGGRVQVRGQVFVDLGELAAAVTNYLATGKSCHCEECDH